MQDFYEYKTTRRVNFRVHMRERKGEKRNKEKTREMERNREKWREKKRKRENRSWLFGGFCPPHPPFFHSEGSASLTSKSSSNYT